MHCIFFLCYRLDASLHHRVLYKLIPRFQHIKKQNEKSGHLANVARVSVCCGYLYPWTKQEDTENQW